MSLNRIDLDTIAARGCQEPGCSHEGHDQTIYFHGRCCMGGPIEASYTLGTGILRIGCRECGETIAEVKVAV